MDKTKTTPLTQSQLDFLQHRYDVSTPGHGEHLGLPGTFHYPSANHYKIWYRTCQLLTWHWSYVEPVAEPDAPSNPPDLAKAVDFLRPIHPYFGWVLGTPDEGAAPEESRYSGHHEAWTQTEARDEFERLFWFHYENGTDHDLPPEIVAKQAREKQEHEIKYQKEQAAKLKDFTDQIQTTQALYGQPNQPEQELLDELNRLNTTVPTPYINWPELHQLQKAAIKSRRILTKPKSLDETRARLQQRVGHQDVASHYLTSGLLPRDR